MTLAEKPAQALTLTSVTPHPAANRRLALVWLGAAGLIGALGGAGIARAQTEASIPALAHDPSQPTLYFGTVLYRERIALPPQAVLQIDLRDGMQKTPLSRYEAVIGSASPLEFSIRVEPAILLNKTPVLLEARILVDGKVWFASANLVPLPDAPERRMSVLVQHMRSTDSAPAVGPQGHWLAEDILGGGVLDGPPATLSIDASGVILASGGCNRITGKAQIGTETLIIGPMTSTEMACAPAIMDQEGKLMTALARARAFRLIPEQEKLALMDDRDMQIMLLSRQDGPQS